MPTNNEAIALCISGFAAAWKRGNISPMDAELRTWLTPTQKREVENAVRNSPDPTRDAYRTVMRLICKRKSS